MEGWKPQTLLWAALVSAAMPCASWAVTAAQNARVDARTMLRAGIGFDAGSAIRNMKLIASVPAPRGFVASAGIVLPQASSSDPAALGIAAAAPAASAASASGGPRLQGREFSKTDLAFGRGQLIQGGYHGLLIYDISGAGAPRLISATVCPGGQGDVSLHGKLVFVSVEETRARTDCGTAEVNGESSSERFRGIRVFDISDPARPRQIAAVQTCRGSHTNTIVPDPRERNVLWVYSSGMDDIRPTSELAGCSKGTPDVNPNSAEYAIDLIRIPLDAPRDAAVFGEAHILADPVTGKVEGLWMGGNHGAGTQTTSTADRCHDLTAYPSLNLLAGACAGNGVLVDISDPGHPRRITTVSDPNFAFWHSAIFSNDGSKLIFTDEWGGGKAPHCQAGDPRNWGGDALFVREGNTLALRSYYKLPTVQNANENCVAHNGGLVPVPGRDILVQGWYSGGTSVMDFTDTDHPREIAYYDRGGVDPTLLKLSGSWSSYWYNGRIYVSDLQRGLEVLELTPSADLSANEIAAARLVHADELNVQSQRAYTWPDAPVVARAYLDQLRRSGAVSQAQDKQISAALASRGGDAARALAAELDRRAAQATVRDVERFSAIARILRVRTNARR